MKRSAALTRFAKSPLCSEARLPTSTSLILKTRSDRAAPTSPASFVRIWSSMVSAKPDILIWALMPYWTIDCESSTEIPFAISLALARSAGTRAVTSTTAAAFVSAVSPTFNSFPSLARIRKLFLPQAFHLDGLLEGRQFGVEVHGVVRQKPGELLLECVPDGLKHRLDFRQGLLDFLVLDVLGAELHVLVEDVNGGVEVVGEELVRLLQSGGIALDLREDLPDDTLYVLDLGNHGTFPDPLLEPLYHRELSASLLQGRLQGRLARYDLGPLHLEQEEEADDV